MSEAAIIEEQRVTIRKLELKVQALERRHHFCPDCRDKVQWEPCLRCQVQGLQRKLEAATDPRLAEKAARWDALMSFLASEQT